MDFNDSILITGGNGFIGSHLIDLLATKGYKKITSIDNLSGSNYGRNININPLCSYLFGDISNISFMDKVFAENEFKYIFHIAANGNVPYSNEFPMVDFNSNALGTLNIFNLALKYKSEKLIFASTAAVYGVPDSIPVIEASDLNPISNYGLTKLYGEKLAIAYYKTYGLKSNVIRIFNTYGPRQPRYVLYDFIKKLSLNKTKLEVLGDGEQIRDYAYVSDTASAFYNLMINKNINGEVFNISGGNPINIKCLVKLISGILNIDPIITYTGKSWPGDIKTLNGDISKLKSTIGFEPQVSINQGLELSIEWFKINGYI